MNKRKSSVVVQCGWVAALLLVVVCTTAMPIVEAFRSSNLQQQRLRMMVTSHGSRQYHFHGSDKMKVDEARNGIHGNHHPHVSCHHDDHSSSNLRSTSTAVYYRDGDDGNDKDVQEQTKNPTSSNSPISTTLPINNLLHAGDIKWVGVPQQQDLRRQKQQTDNNKRVRMRDHLGQLFSMTRPKNLPGVVLFHMLGIWLTHQHYWSIVATHAAKTAVPPTTTFWQLLLSPSMMVTLLALILTSATSMLVNDYYDFKLGNDEHRKHNLLSSSSSSSTATTTYPSPLPPSQRLPPILVKRFTSYLYAVALFCVTVTPGIPSRCAVVSGLMLTFWYTQHLKPKTWLKNVVCAGLISMSPVTSGMAARSYLMSSALTASASSTLPAIMMNFSLRNVWSQIVSSRLLHLFAIVFIGILGREMTMDINDVEDDAKHNVRTVPVVYGRKVTSIIGVVCSLCVTLLVVMEPISTILMTSNRIWFRRLVLASVGGLSQLRRSIQVYRSEGRDPDIIETAVNEGLLSVILIMASFV